MWKRLKFWIWNKIKIKIKHFEPFWTSVLYRQIQTAMRIWQKIFFCLEVFISLCSQVSTRTGWRFGLIDSFQSAKCETDYAADVRRTKKINFQTNKKKCSVKLSHYRVKKHIMHNFDMITLFSIVLSIPIWKLSTTIEDKFRIDFYKKTITQQPYYLSIMQHFPLNVMVNWVICNDLLPMKCASI